jgi:hypothetical protein
LDKISNHGALENKTNCYNKIINVHVVQNSKNNDGRSKFKTCDAQNSCYSKFKVHDAQNSQVIWLNFTGHVAYEFRDHIGQNSEKSIYKSYEL